MTIEELEDKHFNIDEGNVEIPISFVNSHTKLSIQFAISLLKELEQFWIGDSKMIYVDEIQGKIQELKQYLNEK